MKFTSKREQKNVALWCFFMTLSIWLMSILGGMTRLTGSGLSITVWDPIVGIFPPFTQESWEAAFALYKQTPEFSKVNCFFNLGDFKSIFWLEYLHRLWGRLLGTIFIIPCFYFVIKKWITPRRAFLYFSYFSLGLLQGAVGWYMVKSGLIDKPWVSPFRLALHLTLASILLVLFFREGLILWWSNRHHKTRYINCPKSLLRLTLFILFFTLFWGALVAGNKAGLIYNTFPKMGSHWIAPDCFNFQPWWKNIFDNQACIQFAHRILALITFFLSFLLVILGPKNDKNCKIFFFFVTIQIVLGISTLLFQVPIFLGVIHQGWGLLTLILGVFLWYTWFPQHSNGTAQLNPAKVSLQSTAKKLRQPKKHR